MHPSGTRVGIVYVAAGCLRAAREFTRRTRRHGLHAGWTALRAHAWNFYIRVRNKACRRPRVMCPCCGWTGYAFRILDVGHWIVPHVACPRCGNHDRHRMLHYFFQRRAADFFRPDGRLLHVAPEPETLRFLQSLPGLRVFISDLQLGAMGHAGGQLRIRPHAHGSAGRRFRLRHLRACPRAYSRR